MKAMNDRRDKGEEEEDKMSSQSKGSEMQSVQFPPPPRLPPRRPVQHHNSNSNNNKTITRPRVNSMDLLDHVPPAPSQADTYYHHQQQQQQRQQPSITGSSNNSNNNNNNDINPSSQIFIDLTSSDRLMHPLFVNDQHREDARPTAMVTLSPIFDLSNSSNSSGMKGTIDKRIDGSICVGGSNGSGSHGNSHACVQLESNSCYDYQLIMPPDSQSDSNNTVTASTAAAAAVLGSWDRLTAKSSSQVQSNISSRSGISSVSNDCYFDTDGLQINSAICAAAADAGVGIGTISNNKRTGINYDNHTNKGIINSSNSNSNNNSGTTTITSERGSTSNYHHHHHNNLYESIASAAALVSSIITTPSLPSSGKQQQRPEMQRPNSNSHHHHHNPPMESYNCNITSSLSAPAGFNQLFPTTTTTTTRTATKFSSSSSSSSSPMYPQLPALPSYLHPYNYSTATSSSVSGISNNTYLTLPPTFMRPSSSSSSSATLPAAASSSSSSYAALHGMGTKSATLASAVPALEFLRRGSVDSATASSSSSTANANRKIFRSNHSTVAATVAGDHESGPKFRRSILSSAASKPPVDPTVDLIDLTIDHLMSSEVDVLSAFDPLRLKEMEEEKRKEEIRGRGGGGEEKEELAIKRSSNSSTSSSGSAVSLSSSSGTGSMDSSDASPSKDLRPRNNNNNHHHHDYKASAKISNTTTAAAITQAAVNSKDNEKTTKLLNFNDSLYPMRLLSGMKICDGFEQKVATEKTKICSDLEVDYANCNSNDDDDMTMMMMETNVSKRLKIVKKSVRSCDRLEEFVHKLKQMRSQFPHDDASSNGGLVVSPTLETQRDDSLSVKLVISSCLNGNSGAAKGSSDNKSSSSSSSSSSANQTENQVVFTCNVNTSIEHIISHVVCSLVDDISSIDLNCYLLRVFARNEFLTPDSLLVDYVYVLECHKFDRDVQLTLVHADDVDRIYARTAQDDSDFMTNTTADSLLPNQLLHKFRDVNFNSISILIETLDREVDRVLLHCLTEQKIRHHQARQAVQAICAVCGKIETEPLRLSLEDFTSRIKNLSELKVRESSNYAAMDNSSTMELIESAVRKLYASVTEIIQLYSETFPVDFSVRNPPNTHPRQRSPGAAATSSSSSSSSTTDGKFKRSTDCHEGIICWIGQLSQPDLEWSDNYRKFYMQIELWHGNRRLSSTRTQAQYMSESFLKFPRIQFEEWITFESMPMDKLPRETCIYYSLIGIQYLDPEAGSTSPKREISSCLSISMIRMFDSDQNLIQGSRLLPMWRQEMFNDHQDNKFSINCHNHDPNAPLVTISFPEFEYQIKFPPVVDDSQDSEVKYFSNSGANLSSTAANATAHQRFRPHASSIRQLDSATQTDIYQVLNQDPIDILKNQHQQLLWNHRYSLVNRASALARVLQAVKDWDYASLPEIYNLINKWSELSAIDAMQLLLSSYPDLVIRRKAVEWISSIGSDGLCDFLPQLVQAIRFEPYLDSPLVWYFLQSSLTSVRVAHQLYWLLKENIDDPLLGFRSSVLLNALMACCGQSLRQMIKSEESFQQKLTQVNETVKNAKENSRLTFLHHVLEPVDEFLKSTPKGVALPLSPSLLVKGLVISNCSYFTSNTLPLKLVFLPSESNRPESISETIFKIGDDLRQDTLTMQIIRIMEKLWLKEGLDLKIVSFNCVSTDARKGFVEMVKNAETLRKIQQEQGIAGSFNERSIVDWLRKHNTNELDYFKAQENFINSCAGYAVATYLLGICDRHNDNIMITTSGHLFHIDFGKFLGDAQMVGTIRRDRVPFVLTSDMAFVINGGSETTKQFQSFVELCCQAFSIVRRHSNLFLSLFSLMTSANIPGVTSESVKYVHRSLLPELSEGEAEAQFTRKIEESLKSRSVQLNFFVHTLGQMRFTGDHNDERLLSFVPKTCTKETDGRILNLTAVSYHKKYEPDKQYFHIIRVDRSHQPDPSYVSRSYAEFYEFYQKLASIFPLVPLTPLPTPSSTFSRSNTQEVAEKRKKNINKFLGQLMANAEEITHCDLVYTFFQPLLRDQELQNAPEAAFPRLHRRKQTASAMISSSSSSSSVTVDQSNNSSSFVQIGMTSPPPTGEVKLKLHYKNHSLTIMVMFAKNLKSRISDNRQPNTYVKTKLSPDQRNESKRKTKVVARNSDPVFMELIVYRESLSVLQSKILNLSVWESDLVHGNTYLGASLIPLGQMDLLHESESWYPFTG